MSFTRFTSCALGAVALLGGCDGNTANPGTGGAGGSGADGGPHACTKLVQTGDLVRLPSVPGSSALARGLAALGDGRTAVTYLANGPAVGASVLGANDLAWTKDWPPVATAPFTLADHRAFIAPVGRAAPQGIPLVVPTPGPSAMSFGFADPQQGGWSKLTELDLHANRTAFLTGDGAGTYFFGTYATSLHVGWIDATGNPTVTALVAPDCPNDAILANAVATEGGWLLARNTDDCTSGLPLGLRVTRFANAQEQPGEHTEITDAQNFTLLPRPGGAWLLLYETSNSALLAARLDSHAKTELGPMLVSSAVVFSAYADAFAADALDGGFVVAMIAGPDRLGLVVADDQGKSIASAELSGVPTSPSNGQLLFDPQTRQVLVALAMPDGVGPDIAMHVARFSCQ